MFVRFAVNIDRHKRIQGSWPLNQEIPNGYANCETIKDQSESETKREQEMNSSVV